MHGKFPRGWSGELSIPHLWAGSKQASKVFWKCQLQAAVWVLPMTPFPEVSWGIVDVLWFLTT